MPQFAMPDGNGLPSAVDTRPLQCQHLAIVMPTWVGDACMATPTLRAIRERYPQLKISLVCRPVIRDLIWGAWGDAPAWCDASWLVTKSGGPGVFTRRELMRALRSSDVDAALLLPNAFWAAAVMRLAGIRRLIGYHRDARGWLLSDRLPVSTKDGKPRPISAVDYYASLSAWIDAPLKSRAMQLRQDTTGHEMAEELLRRVGYEGQQPLLVLNSGAATEPSRVWPEERVADMAHRAAEELGYFVLIHCGPAERNQAERIAATVAHQRVASMGLHEQLPISLSKSILARAAVVVTTDSGPRHIAVAFDRPVITLFGPTSPQWTTTYNTPETIVQGSNASCSSMADISVEQVLQALRGRDDTVSQSGQIAA